MTEQERAVAEAVEMIRLEAQQAIAEAKQKGEVSYQGQRLLLLADRLEGSIDRTPLRTTKVSDKVSTMTPRQAEFAQRYAQQKGFQHPFHKLINERGMSVEDAALKLDVSPHTVFSWLRSTQVRRVPESVARKAQRLWGFEATPMNWPNGIRDGK